jgi:transposase
MDTESAASPQSWREGRRLRALVLHEEGWCGKAIAEALGVTGGAVSQWRNRARDGGVEALRDHPPPGPVRRLSEAQGQQVLTVLAKGAEAAGFLGEVWTTKRVAHVIQQECGIRYHPAHVSRLLRALGWSVQKPIRRATQRDEAAIEAWHSERWPALEKKGAGRAADGGVGG